MPRRWTTKEETRYRKELFDLYVRKNKTIGEIGDLLNLSGASVFGRMRRLGVPTAPHNKPRYCNKRTDIRIPSYSASLAEFVGIMLGDGHLSRFQVAVTLGSKEYAYVTHVQALMKTLFKVPAAVIQKKSGHREVYIGSTAITGWLREMGLVSNKVREQVSAPRWIFSKEEYLRAFVRGFFDTDGSLYRLRFGIQISFTNHSRPLLVALQTMLKTLEYSPSAISAGRVYLTRRVEVERFFREIAPANLKHRRRYREFMRRWWSGKHTTL